MNYNFEKNKNQYDNYYIFVMFQQLLKDVVHTYNSSMCEATQDCKFESSLGTK